MNTEHRVGQHSPWRYPFETDIANTYTEKFANTAHNYDMQRSFFKIIASHSSSMVLSAIQAFSILSAVSIVLSEAMTGPTRDNSWICQFVKCSPGWLGIEKCNGCSHGGGRPHASRNMGHSLTYYRLGKYPSTDRTRPLSCPWPLFQIYFLAWSVSFYPQAILNWHRKRWIELTYDCP